MSRLNVFNSDSFNASNLPSDDIILILEAWSAAQCDDNLIALKFSSFARKGTRISQFFLRMDNTEGGIFTSEGVQAEAEALLDGILELRRNDAEKPSLLFIGQGFGGVLLKQALALLPRNVEEFDNIWAHVRATVFVCTLHRWKDADDLQNALKTILISQHAMENTKALSYLQTLSRVVIDTSNAFHNTQAIFGSILLSVLPAESAVPEAALYRNMGQICHPLEGVAILDSPYDEMLGILAELGWPILRSENSQSDALNLDRHLLAALCYAAPQYPLPHFTENMKAPEGNLHQGWSNWLESAGAGFKFIKNIPEGCVSTTDTPCLISKLNIGNHFGFAFDFSSGISNYNSLNTLLSTWLSQLLSQFKSQWLSGPTSEINAPRELSQHLNAVDNIYRLRDADLFRACVCSLKDNLRANKHLPALFILNNINTSVKWQIQLVEKLREVFQSSELRLKVLITSPKIEIIEESLGIAPRHFQQKLDQNPVSAAAVVSSKIPLDNQELQSIDIVAWHIVSRYDPSLQELRSKIASFAPWLRHVVHRWLQENSNQANIRVMIDDLLISPTDRSVIRTIFKYFSNKKSLAMAAMTIILWSMRPLEKTEFECLLNIAMSSVSTSNTRSTYDEVASLFQGLVTKLNDRICFSNDIIREILQSPNEMQGVEWWSEEIESHAALADWCLRYLHLPANMNSLSQVDKSGRLMGTIGRGHRHGLLWYAVDHWPEHARRGGNRWNTELPSFQALLANEDSTMHSWVAAKLIKQHTPASILASPSTGLSILAQYGLLSALHIVMDKVRGHETFKDELAAAFIAAAGGGHLETVCALSKEAELEQYDVNTAVLAAIESGVDEVLREVIDHAVRFGRDFGDIAALLARAASLNNCVAVQTIKEMIISHKALDKSPGYLSSLNLACHSTKPEMLLLILGLGIRPPLDNDEGWRQPMDIICRYGSSALVKPFLNHFKSVHPPESHIIISVCQVSLRTAKEYGQLAVISCILGWASENSLVLLTEDIDSWADFRSAPEHTKLLAHSVPQPSILTLQDTFFKKVVFSSFHSEVVEIAQELLRSPLGIDEHAFCALFKIAGCKRNEELIKLICSVGTQSRIDMSHPLVRREVLDREFIEDFIMSGDLMVHLLENGLDPNMRIAYMSRSMLGRAAYDGKIEAVRALLAAGAKVDDGGDDWTPLHCAYDNVEIAKLLLQHGADVNKKDNAALSALYFASKWNYSDIVRAILEKRPHRDTLEQALGTALSNSRIDIAKILAEHDPDLTIDLHDAREWLTQAVETSDVAYIELVLDRCRNLDLNHRCSDKWAKAAIHHITHETQASIVRALVIKGANVNILDWGQRTPLWYAVATDNLNVAHCLVRWGANVNSSTSERAVHVIGQACLSASLEFIKFLVSEGAEVNITSHRSYDMPLHAALLRAEDIPGKAQIIDYLLGLNTINVRIRSPIWGSTMNVAALKCSPKIVARLLKMGVEANDIDHLRRRPIHFALLHSVEMAKLLLDQIGVTLDEEDKIGRHALHFAVQSQRLDVVEFVLQERPNLINKADIHNWTPLLWAMRPPPRFFVPERTDNELQKILELLISKGANKFVKGEGAGNEVWTPVRLASYCSLNVLEVVGPSPEELQEYDGDDRTIWSQPCDRRGEIVRDGYCDVCLAFNVGVNFECADTNCIDDFCICWKCALSKELLHPGSMHILSALGSEEEVLNSSSTPATEVFQYSENEDGLEDEENEDDSNKEEEQEQEEQESDVEDRGENEEE